MKKRKAKKVAQHRTELDRIATQLRTMFRRDTTSVIEKGKLLLRSRELLADEHGEWMPWLAENFDLSYRSAVNYCNAASYVARKSKSATVADFANLSPTVLYRLADRGYTEQEEAEIVAQAKAGKRVDQDAASAICERLAPDDDADDDDDVDDAGDNEDKTEDAAAEDAETAAILDGPPPDVPPPAPIAAPPDFALGAFDQAVSSLRQLITKPAASFDSTGHKPIELKAVADFLTAVCARLQKRAAAEIEN